MLQSFLFSMGSQARMFVSSLVVCFFFTNQLTIEMSLMGKHGIQMISCCFFADDVVLFSSTIVGLQKQLNNMHTEANRLKSTLNFLKK